MAIDRRRLAPWLAAAAVLFAAGSLFHAWRIFASEASDATPGWRHALFIAIDAAVAVGLVKRPSWFPYLFLLLTIQQLGSHGSAAWLLWSQHRGLDMISIGVVVIMPLVCALLFWDARLER
jgi:hypothetical protein